ncbi:MAG: TRAP transporter small permease subunit, partial [Alphaproteobacteria bacterium]
MISKSKRQGVQKLSGRLLKALAAFSGVALFVIMCLVSYAVFRRYVMNDPVLGDAEIVQMGMSIVVMMAMPYATASGAHIRVDIFDRKIGCWGRYLGDAL